MMRIGHGYDVHKLVPGRPLILGGVTIENSLGLLGHSDADVLLHAICDAILGALALGDIGKHFPDTDETYAGADSRELLRKVVILMRQRGYRLGNLDATMICQKPKLATYLPTMVEHIAEDCCSIVENVNVKATTTEKLGFCGREEGIAAEAVVLLIADEKGQAVRQTIVTI
jgi:2-C-methyl-D-erythritol 2,4-cyclodiphosphate synthase